ncbi:MAG TPA: VOC family protein [Terriglobales bacterium]|nr:VOC family protein [Terriglobales bacterium]
MKAVSYKPGDLPAVIPYLLVPDSTRAVQFAKDVLGAREQHIGRGADGRIQHATLLIGDAAVMIGLARPEWPANAAMVYVYVPDVDATYQHALAAGATSVREPKDEPYGDRGAGVKDRDGTTWWLATHKEDLSGDEIERRVRAQHSR